MMRLSFVIDGKPIPQERPFFARGIAFDRAKSKAEKKRIGMLATMAMIENGARITLNPLIVWLHFHGAHGKSDADNLTKLVFDALTDIVWVDDSQVMELHAIKVKEDNPKLRRTIVNIEEIGG